MKKLFSKILSLAMVGTMAISNCPSVSALNTSDSGGGGSQYKTIVVHTPEEFFEVFDESAENHVQYDAVYIANDLDFSSYDNFTPVDNVGTCSIIGYDEDTGEEVQRTLSNITFTTSGILRDTFGENCEQPDYNLGIINTYGGIDNICFDGINVTVDNSYERDNGVAYPHFNVMSACGYENVSVYNVNINVSGYYDLFNVLGDSWNLHSAKNIIVDGVTVNGGDIHLFNTLPYTAIDVKNVDVRNIEINADNLDWVETLGWSVGDTYYDESLENITVSDITINNDIVGFCGIGGNICADLNNCAVQNVNINGSAECVSSIGFVSSNTYFSNFLVRNINVESLTGKALFGGITNSGWWSSAESEEDLLCTKYFSNGYIDIQSPLLGGVYAGGLFNETEYDATGKSELIGSKIYYTTDTPVIGINEEYADLSNFKTTMLSNPMAEQVYGYLFNESDAWTIKDGQIDILPWYELPQDSQTNEENPVNILFRIKKYILNISTDFDESLDLNSDGVINILDYDIELSQLV